MLFFQYAPWGAATGRNVQGPLLGKYGFGEPNLSLTKRQERARAKCAEQLAWTRGLAWPDNLAGEEDEEKGELPELVVKVVNE